jgi:hypothetical protein
LKEGPWTALLFVEPKSSDRPNLLKAVAELQNYEPELHETRLPDDKLLMPTRG